MPVPRFTQGFQVAPDGLNFLRSVIRRVGALPGEDLYEVRLAGVVFASRNEAGNVEDQAEAPVTGPCLGMNCREFRVLTF